MIYKIFPAVLFLFFLQITQFSAITKASQNEIVEISKPLPESEAEIVYNSLHCYDQSSLPNLKSFSEALKGFNLLKERGLIKKNILTLVDFSLSSNTKRLWVIDLTTKTILFNSLVAHGRNTGEEFATNFSNREQSFQSSLGFYSTGEIYKGKHGSSLKLDGLDRGVNDNARDRGIVIHAADYVSNSFIKNNKRLGRSQGCPAIPAELSNEIINTIKEKSCLFIYHPSGSMQSISKLIS